MTTTTTMRHTRPMRLPPSFGATTTLMATRSARSKMRRYNNASLLLSLFLFLLLQFDVASPNNLFDNHDNDNDNNNNNDNDYQDHDGILFSPPVSPNKSPRIIGGTPLPQSELHHNYPYMASLGWGVHALQHRCGGTLIAPDLLLTAAHCAVVKWEEEEGVKREWFTEDELEDGFVPSIYTVQLGKADLNSESSDTTTFHSNYNENVTSSSSSWSSEALIIEKTILHPNFNVSKPSGPPHPDVAIVKLYGASKLDIFANLNSNENLPPPFYEYEYFDIHTNTSTVVYGNVKTTLTTMGYGTHTLDLPSTTSTSFPLTGILQSTTVTYIPNDECKPMGGGGLWRFIEEDMMCGYGDGVRDSCAGDSGGPLFWERSVADTDNSTENGTISMEMQEDMIYQVGIVSWGVGCAHPNYPGVYTRISSHYEWIRNQTCTLSKSPPASFACPPPPLSSKPLPISITPLIVKLRLTRLAYRYGLLVESLMDDGDIHGGQPTTTTITLLDIPPGSFKGMSGTQQYSLDVKLGGKYRIVLLNIAGAAEFDNERLTVKWGDKSLVNERANQGSLQVYSIERHFAIDEFESGNDNPSVSPSNGIIMPSSPPSHSGIEMNERIPLSTIIAAAPDPAMMSHSQSVPSTPTTMVIDIDFTNMLSIHRGTHTIDADHIATNFGYSNGNVPMGISILDSFVLLSPGVHVMPSSGHAIVLSEGSYLMGNGGWLVGGNSNSSPSSQSDATTTLEQSRLRNANSLDGGMEPSLKVAEGEVEAGHGMVVIGSNADIMDGFLSEGGNSVDVTRTAGAGIYVTQGSSVNIRGGRFNGGQRNLNLDSVVDSISTSTLNGPSIIVDGDDSIIHIHQGTFHGKWKVSSGGTIVVHACSITIDRTGSVVHATLADGSQLEVPYTIETRGNISSTIVQGCEQTLASKGDAPSRENAITHDDPSLGTPTSSMSGPPPQPTHAMPSTTSESTPVPTIPTSQLLLSMDNTGVATSANTNKAPGPAPHDAIVGTTPDPSKPTSSLSLQMDVEDLIFPSAEIDHVSNHEDNINSSGNWSHVGGMIVASVIGIMLLFMDIF